MNSFYALLCCIAVFAAIAAYGGATNGMTINQEKNYLGKTGSQNIT